TSPIRTTRCPAEPPTSRSGSAGRRSCPRSRRNGKPPRHDRRSAMSRRRQLSRRAWLTLACGLLFFLAPPLTLSVRTESAQPELRDPRYGYRFERLQQSLAEETGRPLVLVLGSSRVEVGFSPRELPPCTLTDGRQAMVFNFGLAGNGRPLLEL